MTQSGRGDIVGNADGSIIIDTKIDTKGIGSGAVAIEGQFKNIFKSLKKLAAVIGGAFTVGKLVQFGKEAIRLGSDLQEVQNVVDVTFTTMNEQVNQFAKNAKYSAGLSETMAKQYAGTFGAMAKSFKFTEKEAYTMATALTQLAGDTASFYNISQDLAFTKLKSVFSGETETLKDLGIVMTQAALNEFAMSKGISQTVESMTEQQKVALRYQFVMEQLSTASGDFQRTSKGWANQTRMLALQFDELKATIGQGLINALTPVIQVINSILGKLQALANAFKAFTAALFGDAGGGAKGAAKSYEAAAQGVNDLADGIGAAGGAAKKAQKQIAGFDQITKLSDTSGGGSGGAAAGGTFDFGLGIDPAKQSAIEQQTQTMVDNIMQYLEPLKSIDFLPLEDSIARLKTAFSGLGTIIKESLEWAWFNILVPLSTWTIQEGLPAGINLFSSALDFLRAVLQTLQPFGEWLWNNMLVPLGQWTGGVIIKALQTLSGLLSTVAGWITKNQTLVQDFIIIIGAFAAAWAIVNGALKAWNIAVALWNSLGAIATAVTTGFGGAVAFLTSPVTLTIAAIGALIAIVVLLIKHWDDVKAAGIAAWEGVKHAWNGVANWFKEYITDPIASFFSEMGKAIKSAVNGIIGSINGLIRGAVNGINAVIQSLNKLSFTVPDWVPGFGGNRFGFNIGQVSAPQIPYLAKGAVIPPNAPFMAMLGDQRNGTNIEAPLSTIQEAVAAVMEDFIGGTMAGFEATVAVLKEILEAILGIEIGDEVIGEAVKRYNQKMNVLRGV